LPLLLPLLSLQSLQSPPGLLYLEHFGVPLWLPTLLWLMWLPLFW
jgi:hypothetical protein